MRTIGFLLLSASILAAGCRATVQPHVFSRHWPESIHPSGISEASAAGPVVLVEPVVLDTGGPEAAEARPGKLLTAEVLTEMLVRKLRSEGLNAVTREKLAAEPDFTLTPLVPRLVYAQRSGFPRKMSYAAGLACRLSNRDGRVLWQRDLENVIDRVVLVNTMTKLPGSSFEHDQILIQKCVEPVWKMMATGVGESVKQRPAVALAGPEPDPQP